MGAVIFSPYSILYVYKVLKKVTVIAWKHFEDFKFLTE